MRSLSETLQSLGQEESAYPGLTDYRRILARFPSYAVRGWHGAAGSAGVDGEGYFGDPGNEEAGLRTVGNFIFTAALLASDPEIARQSAAGEMVAGEMLGRARACLRYATRGHLSGDRACADGKRWGHAWQSPWWTTKLALGARLIWDRLPPAERSAVERVVASEASFLLDWLAPSGLFQDTKAEENAWRCEVLATAISLMPSHEKAGRWRLKLVEYAINTLSAPMDLTSSALVDGLPVRDQVYTVNLHGDFTVENHGACHFCYVASPLVSIAWSYYALISGGQAVPEALFHHVADFWSRFKGTFLESRFAYLGGKDWARYTYGLYFIVPALVLLQHQLEDADARSIEAARLATLEWEQEFNGDGSFFGKRVTHGRMMGQEAKYETDCFADVGLAYLLHRQFGPAPEPTPPDRLQVNLSTTHVSPEGGVAFFRSPSLFASFSWSTLTQPIPNALFIPRGMDSASEWAKANLLGRVKIWGIHEALYNRAMRKQSEGFECKGSILYRGRGKELLFQEVRYLVDPRRNLAEVESRFEARTNLFLLGAEGLSLHIVNDIFNGCLRTYHSERGSQEVRFDPTQRPAGGKFASLARQARRLFPETGPGIELEGNWVNVDDRLGIIRLGPGAKAFRLRTPLGRNIQGNLHCEILVTDVTVNPLRRVKSGTTILHTHFLLLAGTAEATRELGRQVKGERGQS